MDGNEKALFYLQQQALFRRWITSPSAGYVRQNPDGTPYREPQPTLTDAEREAVLEGMAVMANAGWNNDGLRCLLERLG